VDSMDLAHWRMHNLRLSGTRPSAADDVVRWLGAVQSQEYGPAKWAVGQRTDGTSDAAMDQAFADGTILRTHVLRPTWHFVTPADIGWLLELTAPRVHALNAYYYRQNGLDDTVFRQCHTLLENALRDGTQLTRTEVQARLGAAGIAADGLRLGLILMNAELNGIICSGALKGRQHTYALLDERVPLAKNLSRDEALAELTSRYFTSHGPASTKDFQSWASLTAATVKQGLDIVGSQLTCRVVDEVTYWYAASAADPPPRPPAPTVHLVQGYDEYLMGYTQTKFLLNASGAASWQPRDRPVFIHAVLLDSQLAGHWKRTITADTVVVEAALYAPFDRAQTRALQAAAAQHGEFLGRSATVVTTELG